jgi:hypothetical protein
MLCAVTVSAAPGCFIQHALLLPGSDQSSRGLLPLHGLCHSLGIGPAVHQNLPQLQHPGLLVQQSGLQLVRALLRIRQPIREGNDMFDARLGLFTPYVKPMLVQTPRLVHFASPRGGEIAGGFGDRGITQSPQHRQRVTRHNGLTAKRGVQFDESLIDRA